MKKLKRLLLRLFLFILLAVVAVIIINTISYSSNQIDVPPIKKITVNDNVVQRLSDVVKIPTLSYETHIDTAAFVQLHQYIDSTFPLVDSLLEKTTINQFSRIYKWQGRNPNLQPYLLMAHLDVVPVEKESQANWTEPPYSGKIKDNFIWGRGTLDDKVCAMGILETIERLLKENYEPQRTIYFSFGHDEEVGGLHGAQAIVEYFLQKKITFEYVLDEGSIILDGAIKGLTQPVTLIGTAEKGYCTLQLNVNLEHGGHSSMPPQETAIGILSHALATLEDHPFPTKITQNAQELFDNIGPEMGLPNKAIFANLWLFKGVLKSQFEKSPSSNAMLRTTIAPTIIHGGVKDNVLPSAASATINFRILPGETSETVIAYLNKTINDKRVKISRNNPKFSSEPSNVSSSSSFGFNALQKTSKEIFPNAIVTPSLVVAGTDSRFFEP
ncbi:MAG TPA: M20/M25/M40 family metallo-hydrolase, partial [Phaeodactylibacter sp.]|nr:M20/M25/M40 family metallo-hydrolase [Phaeodactylibacter sp.]